MQATMNIAIAIVITVITITIMRHFIIIDTMGIIMKGIHQEVLLVQG